MNRTGRARGICGAAFVALLLAACGGGGSDLSPEVQAAMTDAASFEKTFTLYAGAGSVATLRSRMTAGFAEVSTLIGGGGDAASSMLAAFSGTPGFADDLKLAIFAYALERMGDAGSASTLATFLRNNATSDLFLSPQFAAAAIQALAGQTISDDTFFFTAEELGQAAALSMGSQAVQGFKAASSNPSCSRQYLLLDGSGNAVTYTDSSGQTRNAVVSGTEFSEATVPSDLAQSWTSQVAAGGGTYVTDDAVFPGSPSKQFNCAGYALREFNGGRRWTADPAKMFDVLTRSGLLIEVSESSAQPGDKVFYFPAGAALPGHVAEVSSVVPGVLSNTVTIRNADGQSGLWQAPSNASYFTGTWVSEAKYPTRKVYRWAGGSAPTASPDPAAAGDSSACAAASGGSFTASVSITGYTLSFSPTTALASNQGSIGGAFNVDSLPAIESIEGSGLSGEVVAFLFDRRQIFGAGSLSFGTSDSVFGTQAAEVVLTYSGPDITHADNGADVVFDSTGGSVTLTSYGTSVGDRLTGSYLANISGTRRTNAAGTQSATLTGTVSGSFDLEIQ